LTAFRLSNYAPQSKIEWNFESTSARKIVQPTSHAELAQPTAIFVRTNCPCTSLFLFAGS
jgi:hypothetical protein